MVIKLQDKEWYKSKTVWSAIVILALSIYQAYTGQPIPTWLWGVFSAFGLYGVRDAIGNISKH